jgi:transposase-like protein
VGSGEAALVAVSHEPDCPFCGASVVTRVGLWGGQIITSQWQCLSCQSYFEAVRGEFDESDESDPDANRALG